MYLNHLLYAADESLWNTFRAGVTFTEEIDEAALSEAVYAAARSFPYFSVKLRKVGDELVLEHNDAPFVISPDGKAVTLGSSESAEHLIAFAYEGCTMYMDACHFLTDGQGSFIFLKTIIYRYLSKLHPEEIFDAEGVILDDVAIDDLDDVDPYPKEELPENPLGSLDRPANVFKLSDQPQGYDCMDGWTSFKFHIPEKNMLSYISSVDGSPSTYIAALLYRAICEAHPDSHLPLVCGVQHSFRHALKKPYSHNCHVNIVPIVYPDSIRDRDIERINTISRGTIILRADDSTDVLTINEHIRRERRLGGMTFEEKRRCVQEAVRRGIGENTFEISYAGRVPWGGLDRYISDFSPYLDMTLSGGMSVEIFSVAGKFCINIMQRSPEDKYVRRFSELLSQSGIAYDELPPERFRVCSFESR